MIAGVGAKSDIVSGFLDPNPVLEIGCPRSVGGIESAAALAISLGIAFSLTTFNCDPFYHGYGPACSDKRLVVARWKLPVTDVYGNKF